VSRHPDGESGYLLPPDGRFEIQAALLDGLNPFGCGETRRYGLQDGADFVQHMLDSRLRLGGRRSNGRRLDLTNQDRLLDGVAESFSRYGSEAEFDLHQASHHLASLEVTSGIPPGQIRADAIDRQVDVHMSLVTVRDGDPLMPL